jgi:hypothetical protein
MSAQPGNRTPVSTVGGYYDTTTPAARRTCPGPGGEIIYNMKTRACEPMRREQGRTRRPDPCGPRNRRSKTTHGVIQCEDGLDGLHTNNMH